MNNNLVPTPRTDRNGKTVIRHMKPAKNASKTALPVPAVTQQSVVNPRKVRQEMLNFLDSNTRHGYPDSSNYMVVDRWLNHSTDDELIELSAVIAFVNNSDESSDPAVLREVKVIRSGIQEMMNSSALTRYVHGFLASRSAFCSEQSTTSDSRLNTAVPLYLGLRCDFHGEPLHEEKLPSPNDFNAALRYIYEISAGIFHGLKLEDGFPVNEIYISREGEKRGETSVHSILPYKDQKLMAFVITHADRVDELIELSIRAGTTNPARLAVMLGHDGHSTLSEGAL